MADETYNFTQARERLEEIVAQVRKKDVSLEKSLDLLEEGVRLANICTELSDHTEWRTIVEEQAAKDGDALDGEVAEQTASSGDEEESTATDSPAAAAETEDEAEGEAEHAVLDSAEESPESTEEPLDADAEEGAQVAGAS